MEPCVPIVACSLHFSHSFSWLPTFCENDPRIIGLPFNPEPHSPRVSLCKARPVLLLPPDIAAKPCRQPETPTWIETLNQATPSHLDSVAPPNNYRSSQRFILDFVAKSTFLVALLAFIPFSLFFDSSFACKYRKDGLRILVRLRASLALRHQRALLASIGASDIVHRDGIVSFLVCIVFIEMIEANLSCLAAPSTRLVLHVIYPSDVTWDTYSGRLDSQRLSLSIKCDRANYYLALLRCHGLHLRHRLHLPRCFLRYRQVWCRYRRYGCPPPRSYRQEYAIPTLRDLIHQN